MPEISVPHNGDALLWARVKPKATRSFKALLLSCQLFCRPYGTVATVSNRRSYVCMYVHTRARAHTHTYTHTAPRRNLLETQVPALCYKFSNVSALAYYIILTFENF
jgi:hypothetical protein